MSSRFSWHSRFALQMVHPPYNMSFNNRTWKFCMIEIPFLSGRSDEFISLEKRLAGLLAARELQWSSQHSRSARTKPTWDGKGVRWFHQSAGGSWLGHSQYEHEGPLRDLHRWDCCKLIVVLTKMKHIQPEREDTNLAEAFLFSFIISRDWFQCHYHGNSIILPALYSLNIFF